MENRYKSARAISSTAAVLLLLAGSLAVSARAAETPSSRQVRAAAVAAAQAEVNRAQAALDRALTLSRENVLPNSAVLQARADLEEARAALLRAEGSSRETVRTAEVAAAQARLDEAQAEYERTRKLAGNDANSPSVAEARANLESARAALLRTRGSLDARQAGIQAARAALDAANARFTRTKTLVQQKYVAQLELDAALADLESARAALARAEAEGRPASRTTRPNVEPQPERDTERKLSARELLQARRDLARQVYEAMIERAKVGQASDPNELYLWSSRWMEAEQEFARNRSERVAAAEAHVARIRELRDNARARFQAGVAGSTDVAEAEYHYLEAEQRLLELKRR